MIRNRQKVLVLLLSVTLLLTCAVGSTGAFLLDSTGHLTNTFDPVYVAVRVDDTIDQFTKKDVTITNQGNVDAYIRVAVIANWVMDDGAIVAPWDAYGALPITADWTRGDDGFYYCTDAVAPGAACIFFTAYSQPTPPVAGAHLEMDIIAQAVQAEGMGATSAADAFQKAAQTGQ